MRAKRISAAYRAAKARASKTPVKKRETGLKCPKNANDHEQRGARTSGAAKLFRGRPGAGAIKRQRRRSPPDGIGYGIPQGVSGTARLNQLGTSLITGPRGAAGAGCGGCSTI